MRSATDKEKLFAFMRSLGQSAKGPGRIYITGGSTALLLGIRNQTIDIDIKLDPEPKGVFESIANLKESLDVSVELASPDQFIPELPEWRQRSEFIGRHGEVDFYHYDFYSQALSKILRGHEIDLADANALVHLGKVNPQKLREYFEVIRAGLIRFPAIDADEFGRRVAKFIEEV